MGEPRTPFVVWTTLPPEKPWQAWFVAGGMLLVTLGSVFYLLIAEDRAPAVFVVVAVLGLDWWLYDTMVRRGSYRPRLWLRIDEHGLSGEGLPAGPIPWAEMRDWWFGVDNTSDDVSAPYLVIQSGRSAPPIRVYCGQHDLATIEAAMREMRPRAKRGVEPRADRVGARMKAADTTVREALRAPLRFDVIARRERLRAIQGVGFIAFAGVVIAVLAATGFDGPGRKSAETVWSILFIGLGTGLLGAWLLISSRRKLRDAKASQPLIVDEDGLTTPAGERLTWRDVGELSFSEASEGSETSLKAHLMLSQQPENPRVIALCDRAIDAPTLREAMRRLHDAAQAPSERVGRA